MFAAVGALSHQRERAFSASLIYLGLGAAAAIVLARVGVGWLDPIADAELIEHLAEAALIMALFSAGLKLDRPLTLRDWSSVVRLLVFAMPITIALVALLGAWLLALPAAAALLLGAALAPTDPVLAGDIGVGPPGDEDEHEPNFALTAEAGLNDGLAAPFILAGVFVAEQGIGGGWGVEWLAADVVYAIALGVAVGAAIGIAAAWSVKRLHSADMLLADYDGFHSIATALVIYGLAEVLGGYGFLGVFAGGIAFRRYEADHELNASAHEGVGAAGEAAGADGDPAAGLDAHDRRSGRAGLAGLADRGAAARGRAARVRPAQPRRLAHGPSRREGVRGLVRRARRRHALLRRGDRDVRRARRRRAGRGRVDVRGRGAAVDRRARRHGRAVAAADARPAGRPGARYAATRSTARDSSRSLSRSSTARSSAGCCSASSPGSSRAATRSSAGRIVSPAR